MKKSPNKPHTIKPDLNIMMETLCFFVVLLLSSKVSFASDSNETNQHKEPPKPTAIRTEVKTDKQTKSEAEPDTSPPCATIEVFNGEIDILDSKREKLLEIGLNKPISCLSWINIRNGWIEIKHMRGAILRIGPNSLFQIFPSSKIKSAKNISTFNDIADGILYKGRVYSRIQIGDGGFITLTPNAVVSLESGVAFHSFDPLEEETQLVSVDHRSVIINRFEPSARVVVGPGEASSLNNKLMSTLPTDAKAVQPNSLKEQLSDFDLHPKELQALVKRVSSDVNRKFASVENANQKKKTDKQVAKSTPDMYSAYEEDVEGRSIWVKKLTGDDTTSFNSVGAKRKPASSGAVQESDTQLVKIYEKSLKKGKRNKNKQEEDEKRRLIEELTKIRSE